MLFLLTIIVLFIGLPVLAAVIKNHDEQRRNKEIAKSLRKHTIS